MPLRILALVTSGVLFYFGTGLAPNPALTWIAPLPVLLLAPRAGAGTTFAVAFLAYLLGLTNQLNFFLHTPSVPLPIGIAILAGSSVVFGQMVLLFRALGRRGSLLLATFVPPAVWVAAGYLTVLTNPTGIIWPFATSVADVPVVTQIASVTGAWGVEYLVLLVPTALSAVLWPGPGTRARLHTGAAALAACALTLGFGVWRLGTAGGAAEQRVAVMSAGRYQWAPDAASPGGQALVRDYARQIFTLPAATRTVVLPEGAFGTDEASLPGVIAPLREAARERGVDVVIGVVHTTPKIKYNYSVNIPADGSEPDLYAKWHFAPGAPFHRGDRLVFATPQIGLANCMDLNFPSPARDYARAGASLLAVPAADEFGNGWQHSRMGLLRGVESGVSVAWAAQWGTPMISDPWGRVLAETDTETAREPFVVAAAGVPAGPGATVYARFGDWFAWLCLALVAGGLIAVRPVRRVTARPDVEPAVSALLL
ncbi:nitrilase-related carbon-nitrogen hydrolase [Nonomuraea sp. SYSU D8015]|uniref:nitrilase-related carbon-nitrogen hydrolase n=1 Tax=Nonomuraea sp. SYSU D8015 TaxID=2593644 RepID=UPI001660A7DC|nr:nitrilase-related carbon-nitrogen hydrolase [Nonomuraea sp. SYSU D8015]